MTAPRARLFNPDRAPEPKYFTRMPDDVLEDPRLTRCDLAVFAHLLRGHWVDGKPHVLTQTELAKRCRMSIRNLRPHLVKLEDHGYLTRVRVSGRDTQIKLTYQLRPILELAADAPVPPVTKGTRETPGVGRKHPTHRMKTSDPSDENIRPIGRKHPTPSLAPLMERARELEKEEKEEEREKNTNPPSLQTSELNHPVIKQEIPPSPEWTDLERKIIASATELWGASNGDFFVGKMLRDYPAPLVREAIDIMWDQKGPRFDARYLHGICRRLEADGWKPIVSETPDSDGNVPAGKTYPIISGPCNVSRRRRLPPEQKE